MGTESNDGSRLGQLPPPPGPTRPPPKPFGPWASQNPFKVAVAVLGGLAVSIMSMVGIDLVPWDVRPDARPKALVFINADPEVCWRVSLNFGRRVDGGCGDASYELEEMMLTDLQPVRFRAQVFAVNDRQDGVVRINLVVDGKLVGRASTRMPSAIVSY